MSKKKKPFLSIITINYNNKIGLEKTLKSVLCQSFQNFEYIIIDGGSTDGSREYLNIHADSLYYWVSERDNGLYNAMNKGIKVANGEYFLFLNSGDFLSTDTALEDFITHEGFCGDIIYGDYKFEQGFKIYPDHLTPLHFIRSTLPHQSTFFKGDIFNQVGFYNEKYNIVADREFYIRCFLCNKFVFTHIQYPLTFFDLSGISSNQLFIELQTSENEKMFQDHYGIFYEDYKNMNNLQRQYNELKKHTIRGVIKRFLNKIRKICRIR